MSIFTRKKTEEVDPWFVFAVDLETGRVKRERNSIVNIEVFHCDVLHKKNDGVWLSTRAKSEKDARDRAKKQVAIYRTVVMSSVKDEAA